MRHANVDEFQNDNNQESKNHWEWFLKLNKVLVKIIPATNLKTGVNVMSEDNVGVLLDMFNCGICLSTICDDKIYGCGKCSAIYCSTCSGTMKAMNIKNCIQCRDKGNNDGFFDPDRRDFSLETMANVLKLKFPCGNDDCGCKLSRGELLTHIYDCKFQSAETNPNCNDVDIIAKRSNLDNIKLFGFRISRLCDSLSPDKVVDLKEMKETLELVFNFCGIYVWVGELTKLLQYSFQKNSRLYEFIVLMTNIKCPGFAEVCKDKVVVSSFLVMKHKYFADAVYEICEQLDYNWNSDDVVHMYYVLLDSVFCCMSVDELVKLLKNAYDKNAYAYDSLIQFLYGRIDTYCFLRNCEDICVISNFVYTRNVHAEKYNDETLKIDFDKFGNY